MKNPFLDLFLQKKDYIENIPQDSDINNVQNMANAQQPTLPIVENLPEINQNAELPETDKNTESDEPSNKTQDFESLLQEYRANREGRTKAIEAAAEQDRRTRLLNNLSKAMAQLNTGLASGYANIKVDPIDLGPADAAARARTAQQGKLGELMTEYKLQKAMEPETESAAEKVKREKLEAERDYKKEQISKMKGEGIYAKKEEKESTWEEKQIKKAEIEEKLKDSNFKKEEEKKTKASLDNIEEQLQKVRRAKQLLKELVKDSSIADTGPLDQYVTSATSRGQKLEQAFNDLSLDKMTKLFKGMSKAVDSDAERKMFEQSQASLSYYPDVNEEILNNLEKALLSSKQKNQAFLQEVTGKELQKESSQTPQEVKHKSGKSFNVGQVIRSKDGKKYRIKNENGDLELVK